MMRKSLIALSVAATSVIALPVHAEKLYDFGSVSLNHIEWFDANPHHESLTFGEVEYGGGYTWGTHYGFIDLERNHEGDNSISIKQNIALQLGESNFNAYGQVFHAESLENRQDFYSTDWVMGVEYTGFSFGNIVYKPFLGAVYSNANGVNGEFNGGMYGHLIIAPINEHFSITNWHETQFGKTDNFDDGEMSQNGAIAAWYHTGVESLDLGLQYRYGIHKLGTYEQAGNHGAIFTVKYNF
jgi:hypothetical protein